MSGAIPPAEAIKGISKGLYTATVVVVAVVALVAGLGLSPMLFPAKPAPAPGTPGAPLLIGTNTPFPPFEYTDANGTVIGFTMDLIKSVLDRTNRTYIVRDFRDWDALLAAVQFEGVDLVASSVTSSGTVGAARNETMSFSSPYFESDQAVLVRKAETRVTCPSTGCEAGNLGGLSVAVQGGTTSDYWVADNLPNATVSKFPDVTQVLQALKASSVDMVVIDKPAGEAFASASPNDYKVVGAIETNELYAFAVPKNDPKHLLTSINSELARMRQDGTYDRILATWFG